MANREQRYETVKILRPSGEWETWKVPRFFSCADVAKHAHHSVVALWLRPGRCVFLECDGKSGGKAEGPCWVVWNPTQESFTGAFGDIEKVAHSVLYDLAFDTYRAAQTAQAAKAGAVC